MKLAVDLHIHSALSPCADDDMTPANIVGMAALKGLDAIAIADHNACFNLRAASECAAEAGVVLLPGIEVTTAEEVHMLVYFDNLERAESFGLMIYESLPQIPNNTDIFGEQLIFDAKDTVCGKAERLLAQASAYSIGDLQKKALEYGGVVVPAHINRQAYSIVETLGFIPEDMRFTTLEVRRNMPMPPMDMSRYRVISSSDAHTLWQILERSEYIECGAKSAAAVFKALGEVQ